MTIERGMWLRSIDLHQRGVVLGIGNGNSVIFDVTDQRAWVVPIPFTDTTETAVWKTYVPSSEDIRHTITELFDHLEGIDWERFIR